MEDRVLCPVLLHRLGKGIEQLVPVLGLIHVDEVDDDDPAQIPEPYLVGDLLHRFDVRLENGVFEALLTYELAGIDIDDGHRLSLVDDDVPARFQPDTPADSPRYV